MAWCRLKRMIVLLMFSAVTCAAPHKPDIMLHESPQGAVYLEQAPRGSFQAAHPLALDQTIIARVLAGVMVADHKTFVQTLFKSETKPARVFSDADVVFLAPLIATALSQAGPSQRVGFRVVHRADPLSRSGASGAGVGSSLPPTVGPQSETTAGSLYAYGLSLHVTLTQYRHRSVKPDTIGGPNRYYPDETGLEQRDVLFQPEIAQRADTSRQTGLFGQSDMPTLVIDYDMLAKLPVPATGSPQATPMSSEPVPVLVQPPATTATTASQDDELQSLKDLVIKKDMELEALKKELRTLKRQLAEREAQLEGLKRRPKPANKNPEPSP